uniref:Uncharacterized protein n=1 Tax=Anopheles epiroticus TaxID=199890 RepID=A0A182PNL3_9DIPT
MYRSVELRELRNAFDAFSVWILLRNATTAGGVNLLHGKKVDPALYNFLVARVDNGINEKPTIAILEYHLTKAQFEAVQENTRKDAIERMVQFLDISPLKYSLQHYLYITNERPPIEFVPSSMTLLNSGELHSYDLSSISRNDLCTISASRELPDGWNRNVYTIAQTIRQGSKIISCKSASIQPLREIIHNDAVPVNGIKLADLSAVLNTDKGRGAPLGLFLVRQAELETIRLYVKKCSVDRLEDVTPDTWFLVSDIIPFETDFPHHLTVHEVSYVTDYGIVFWMRCRGLPTPIGTHFTVHHWEEHDAVLPAPAWLNILVSNVTDGSTTFLGRLAANAKRANPFQMVALLQAADMVEALQKQPIASWIDALCHLLGAESEDARHVVATVPIVLFVDHALADDGSDYVAQTLVQFINLIDDNGSIQGRLNVWIVGDDVLWTRFATTCTHAAIKHCMPKLDHEEQWKECLSQMATNDSSSNIKDALKIIPVDNDRLRGCAFFGNIFTCNVLAENITDRGDGTMSGSLANWWIEAMEQYVWKHIAPPESNDLQKLEQHCYERVFLPSTDQKKHFSSQSPVKHRTIQKLLAVQHLVKHPASIELASFQRVGYFLMDLLLFRHSAVGIAVLSRDVETVRQSSREELQSVNDCLQRNLLHIVHNCPDIADVLLSAEVPLEQQCAPQLNHWTPLQMALERNDWPLVDRLLAKGAKMPTQENKLRTMPVSELEDLFSCCIADSCTTLIVWILQHRPDYRITHENVFTLSVYEEFETELLFRVLTIAQEQGLTVKEPEPYRYIFGNSALDNAVHDERIELATFLVDQLHFEATDAFNELQTQFQNNPRLMDYKQLHRHCDYGDLCKVQQMIEEKGLDPQQEYDGSNIFIRAAASGCLELVQYLFETHGFCKRIDGRDQHGDSALTQAMIRGHQPIVQFLRKHKATVDSSRIHQYSNLVTDVGINIDTEDFLQLIACDRETLSSLNIDYYRYESGELLLHFYIRYADEPNEDTFRYLLSQYDNIDIRTDVTSELRYGETPLHLAFQNGNKLYRRILLESGADIHAKSLRHGLTSLHYAIMGNADRETLQQLLDVYGFDVNTRDERGRTISHYMPLKAELYRWLIERYQFDPNARDNSGQTVLHHRVIENSFFVREKVEFLLQNVQLSQSCTDNRGRLPLHYAAEANCREIVRLLLKYRQDLCHIPDGEGLTSVQIAQNLNHTAIGDLFRSF